MTPEQGIEQAEVMRRWYEQRSLPESERDILWVRNYRTEKWTIDNQPTWNFAMREYRLRKRPSEKTVTACLLRWTDLYAA